ncbi:MAG: hypothetical protein ACI9CE_000008 [Flavobacterium sp.]|jgi:hypothetical protein
MQFDKDMNSIHKNLFLETQSFLLSIDKIEEIKKERITTYSSDGVGLCHMRTMDYGIDLGFLKCAKMKDEHGLLKGKGKVMRVLSLASFDREIFEYYISEAIDVNRQKK